MHSAGNLAEFLATLHVFETAGTSFTHTVKGFISCCSQLRKTLAELRESYKQGGVPNIVRDGTVSLSRGPECKIPGISIEFR